SVVVVSAAVVVVASSVVVVSSTRVVDVVVSSSSPDVLCAKTLLRGLAPVAAAAKPAAPSTRAPENAQTTIVRLRGVSIMNLLTARYLPMTRSGQRDGLARASAQPFLPPPL